MKLRPIKWLPALLVVGALLAILLYFLRQPGPPALPVATTVLSPELLESPFQLRTLTLGGQGEVYGAQGRTLYRIIKNGSKASKVYQFDDSIRAIHEREDGLLIVATDNNHWDPEQACTVYRSVDGGRTFHPIKLIQQGSLLWWSIDSDREGRIYLAEYGPQRRGMSKTLWRSDDDGERWRAIYRAPDRDKVHLHRIAVDPYTDELWLTVGDGKNRSMLNSADHGENWEQVARLQSTAVAFTEEAVFWGRDKQGRPGVLRYDRESKTFGKWFDPGKEGNYGGSVYDMLITPSGDMIVPFMKYPHDTHAASVWRGSEAGEWELLLMPGSEQGRGAGFEAIAGPDSYGWIYMPGYQMNVKN